MKKNFSSLNAQQLHNALQNTIRIFDEYRMDRKMHDTQTFKIISTEAGGTFYLVKYFDIDGGVQIAITCGKPFGKITEDVAQNLAGNLLSRLEQVVNRQIVMSADVANRDVYKTGQGAKSMILLIRLAIAIIAIILGLMVLMR